MQGGFSRERLPQGCGYTGTPRCGSQKRLAAMSFMPQSSGAGYWMQPHKYDLRPMKCIIFTPTDIVVACICGGQFCYVCGVRWKNCRCAHWDEARLVTRANAIVDRDARGQQMNPARRAGLLERERHNVIASHQCTHATWRCQYGQQRCEECRQMLPRYIFECCQCRILACRRCRFNRL